MVTGEFTGRIDRVQDAFRSDGISNPMEMIEQITSSPFIRRLDYPQMLTEKKALVTGTSRTFQGVL